MADPVMDLRVLTYLRSRSSTRAVDVGACDQWATEGRVIACRPLDPTQPPPRPFDEHPPFVEEWWHTDVAGLHAVLASGSSPDLSRLVVRLQWPPRPAAEAPLLLARSETRELHLAVAIVPDIVDVAFAYLTALGLPWVALPAVGSSNDTWDKAMRRLMRLWLFDPRSTVRIEPLASALHRCCLLRAGHDPRWRYRLVDEPTWLAAMPVSRWRPSIHAVLLAGLDVSAAQHLEDSWEDELERQGGDAVAEVLAAAGDAERRAEIS